MPSKDEHLAQARHNKRFYDSLDKVTYPDWASTALFYAALQLIDAYLDTKNIHPPSHDRRDNLVNQIADLRPIAFDYSRLKSSSRNARYYCPGNAGFTPAFIARLEQHFSAIESHLQALISPASPPAHSPS